MLRWALWSLCVRVAVVGIGGGSVGKWRRRRVELADLTLISLKATDS